MYIGAYIYVYTHIDKHIYTHRYMDKYVDRALCAKRLHLTQVIEASCWHRLLDA